MKTHRILALCALACLLLVAVHAVADEGAARRRALRLAQEPLRDRQWSVAAARLAAFRSEHPGTPEAIEAWVLQADALLHAGKAREALAATSDFLRQHGEEAWAARMRHAAAAAYERLGQPERASGILRQLADESTAPKARARIAALHIELADADFEGVETKDDLGRTVKKRNIQRALQGYERALAVGPDAAETTRVRERVARILEELKQYPRAAETWGRLLKDAGHAKRPELADLPPAEALDVERWLVGRGRALLRAGKRAEARADLKAALEAPRKSDHHMEILLLLGEERLAAAAAGAGTGAFEEGVALIRRAILEHRDDPGAARAQRQLAEAYEKRGQSEQAAAEWRALVERFPDDGFVPDARNRAAQALLRAGRHDEAILEWKRFLSAHATHPLWKSVRESIVSAAFVKGAARKKEGDVDGAIAAWRSFAEENQDDGRAPQALLLAAQALRERKDHDAALALYKGVAGRYAKTGHAPAALLAVALVYEDDLQRLDEAIEAYETLIKEYGRTGQANEARTRLQRLRDKHLQVGMERVIGSAVAPMLRVETRNIEKLRVRVYRLGLEEYFQRKGTLAGVENLQLEIVKPDWTSEWAIDGYEPHVLIAADRPVPVKERGAYVVVAGDDDLTCTALFLVSDVECVVKKAEGHQLFVWAFDRETHAPVVGARVLAAGAGEVGKTGKDGVWKGGGREATRAQNVLVLSERGAASTEIAKGQSVDAGFRSKAYVYTDRPVYRPGAKVQWRGIFLAASGGGYQVPKKRKGRVKVFDPRGQEVLDEEVTSTEFGTFSGAFDVDGAAPLGGHRIQLQVDKVGSWDGSFEVQEFRKPEFTVKVTPKKRVFLTGETVAAEVELRYAFGGAVANAPLRYEVWRQPRTFAPTTTEDYAWYFQDRRPDDEDAPPPGALPTALVARKDTKTDARGRAAISFETQELDEDAEYVVRASAQDVTRRWITDQSRIPVTRHDHMAVVKSDRKVYRPKQEMKVEVRTVDARERPLSRSGVLQLMRLRRTTRRLTAEKHMIGRRPPVAVQEEEVEVRQFTLTTDAGGRAELRLQIEQPGRYRLRWRSQSRGQLVTAFTDVEASGEAEDPSKDPRLVAARTLYKEGENAEVLLYSPVSRGKALLTYEGERVLDYRFVDLVSGSTLLDLPLEGRHAPNVFFKVAIPGEEELLEAETEVVVLRHLDVAVEISPATALPGSEVEVTVTTRDANGGPVKAEVGLALVDETVYAVARDTAPAIRPYFYDKRRVNRVVSASSVGTRFYGTTRETSKDLLADAAARTGDAKQVYAQSALRLAREAMRRGDMEQAARQVLLAMRADPRSWDARSLLATLQTNAHAQEFLRRVEAAAAEARFADEEAEDAPAESGRLLKERKSKGRVADRLAEMEKGIGGGAGGAFRGRGGRRRPSAGAAPGMREPSDPASGAPVADARAQLKRTAWKNMEAQQDKKAFESLALLDRAVNAQAGLVAYRKALAGFGLDALGSFEVRREFADTAAWKPHLVTGSDGRATVRVKLPDNLTTWRATARGVSGTALVGAGRGSVLARRNLLVRVDPPRFLTQGDEITIPTAVHNNTEDDLSLTVRLEADGVELGGEDEKVDVPAGGRRISDRQFAAKDPGKVRIEASVGAGPVGDAVEVKFGTLARGLRVFDGRSGNVSAERGDLQETFLDVPENVVAGTNRLTVVLYPGIDEALLDALLYLDLFPYGCIEQTVHRFLPALEARAALSAAGSLEAEKLERLQEAARRGAQRLRNLQNADGSFGWFRGGQGDLAMTAYALRGLAAARLAGIPGLDRSIAQAEQALRQLLKAGAEDVRALGHLALASLGKADTEIYATTFRRRSDDLSVAGLAWMALAADRLGRSFDRDELIRLILERRVEADGLTHWQGRKEDCFTGSDREASALAVQALVVTKTATPHAERGLRWLLAHRVKGGMGTTKETAAFVGAASAWLAQGRTQGFGGTVDVLLDDQVVRSVSTGPRPLQVANRRFEVPEATALSPGRHRLAFRLKGQGSLSWAARLESVLASADLPADEHGVRVDRSYLVPEEAPLPGQPPKTKPGYTILRESAQPKVEPRELEVVGTGDRVLVRLKLTAPRDLEYALVEDPLPAGFEVLEDTSKGPFAWQERRDNRQVFFLTKVPKGSVTLEYVLQATHLGSFTALGTTAYPMYAPEIHGRAAGRAIRVLTAQAAHAPAAEQPPTPDEVYAEAKRQFEEKAYDVARRLMTSLRDEQPLRDEIVEEIEAYLLRAAIEQQDHRAVVRAREELVRRNPGRIPSDLDSARAIAFAYQAIGEHEVANTLFRELVARGFHLEGEWAAALAGIGREVEGLDRLGDVLRRFPIGNATAQVAFNRAQRYRELPRPEGRTGEAGQPMDEETLDALWSVTAHFANTSLAAPANYALVGALRQAGDLAGAATAAEAFLRRFPDSHYVDDAWFFLADVRFRRFEEEPTAAAAGRVREAAEPLVNQKFRRPDRRSDFSPFRARAYHILARVHHVLGELDQAIAMYRQAKNVEDAREALAFLTEERLELEETVMRPLSGDLRLPVRYRNVAEVALKAYPVDLQVLFAVRKTLEGLHKIDLSGIVPAHEWKAALEGHADHAEHTTEIGLPVEGNAPGVWLVIAKAGKHEASSLVIRTDLEVALQRLGDKVRVYVTDAKGRSVRGAYVTVSNGSQIRARGLTDGRGVYEAPGVGATPYVVVSSGDRYAIAR